MRADLDYSNRTNPANPTRDSQHDGQSPIKSSGPLGLTPGGLPHGLSGPGPCRGGPGEVRASLYDHSWQVWGSKVVTPLSTCQSAHGKLRQHSCRLRAARSLTRCRPAATEVSGSCTRIHHGAVPKLWHISPRAPPVDSIRHPQSFVALTQFDSARLASARRSALPERGERLAHSFGR